MCLTSTRTSSGRTTSRTNQSGCSATSLAEITLTLMQPSGWPVKTKVPHSICFDEQGSFYQTLSSGYFSHVTTIAEVKEQVLKYIQVMARPMVLLRDYHRIQWTGVHADIEVITKQTKSCPISNFAFPPIRELRLVSCKYK